MLVQSAEYAFQTYRSGVLRSYACGNAVDHAVLAVGYGQENGINYWIVKNSWGTTWGDQGYIKIGMANGKRGVCGINQDVYFPII